MEFQSVYKVKRVRGYDNQDFLTREDLNEILNSEEYKLVYFRTQRIMVLDNIPVLGKDSYPQGYSFVTGPFASSPKIEKTHDVKRENYSESVIERVMPASQIPSQFQRVIFRKIGVNFSYAIHIDEQKLWRAIEYIEQELKRQEVCGSLLFYAKDPFFRYFRFKDGFLDFTCTPFFISSDPHGRLELRVLGIGVDKEKTEEIIAIIRCSGLRDSFSSGKECRFRRRNLSKQGLL